MITPTVGFAMFSIGGVSSKAFKLLRLLEARASEPGFLPLALELIDSAINIGHGHTYF